MNSKLFVLAFALLLSACGGGGAGGAAAGGPSVTPGTTPIPGPVTPAISFGSGTAITTVDKATAPASGFLAGSSVVAGAGVAAVNHSQANAAANAVTPGAAVGSTINVNALTASIQAVSGHLDDLSEQVAIPLTVTLPTNATNVVCRTHYSSQPITTYSPCTATDSSILKYRSELNSFGDIFAEVTAGGGVVLQSPAITVNNLHYAQVADLNISGADTYDLASVVSFNGKYYIPMDTTLNLFRWVPGSRVVKLSTAVAQVKEVTFYNGGLYFGGANSAGTTQSLYRMNTDESITRLSAIATGGIDNVADLRVLNGYLYFTATNAVGKKLFRINGSDVIEQVTNTNATNSDGLTQMSVSNGRLLWSGTDGSSNRLWQFDPVTGLAKSISSPGAPGNHSSSTPFFWNGLFFHSAMDSLNHLKLFSIDPATFAVNKISDYGLFNDISIFTPSTSVGFIGPDKFVALVNDTSTTSRLALYTYNSIPQLLAHTYPASFDAATLITTGPNNEVYFKSRISASSYKLFKVNATGVITQLSILNPSGDDSITQITNVNGKIYFLGSETGSTTFRGLYRIGADGKIECVLKAATGFGVDSFRVVGSELFLTLAGSAKLARLTNL